MLFHLEFARCSVAPVDGVGRVEGNSLSIRELGGLKVALEKLCVALIFELERLRLALRDGQRYRLLRGRRGKVGTRGARLHA